MYVMFNCVTKNTALFCARLFICLQLLLPSALSFATPNYADLSQLMCSPSGQSLSSEAQAALSDLVDLLQDTDEAPEAPNDHCDTCTISTVALEAPELVLSKQSIGKQLSVYVAFNVGLVHKAQGPPTGSRAPPLSF